MKSLTRICFLVSIFLGLASISTAQEGPSKVEFECLMMSNTSGKAMPNDKSTIPTYHHVWMPGLSFGYFESNGLKLSYEMEGAGDETVIVVHGGPGLPHDYFHPMLSALSRYVTVVYFDRRADMQSTRTPNGVASLEEMADDVDALRKALGLNRVTVFGHSFGGAIALTYALRHPDHLKRLILVNTSAVIEEPKEVEKRIMKTLSASDMAAFQPSEGGGGAGSPCERVRKQYRALYPRYFHKTPDGYSLDSGVYSVYFDALARKLASASSAARFDVRSRLRDIKAPALVLGGRYDVVTPLDHASELASLLPQSRLVVMEHSGHFSFIEENWLFTQWVQKFIFGTADRQDDRIASETVSGSSGSR